MKDRLVGWRHEPPIRIALLVVGALASIGVAVLGLRADLRSMVLPAGLLALVAFMAVGTALTDVALQVPLRELDANDRGRAVGLAWGWPPRAPGTVKKWGALSAALSLAAYVVSLNAESSIPWVLLAAVIPPVGAFVRHDFFERPHARLLALRAAGVEYVCGMYPGWLAKGAESVAQATMTRFQQVDPERSPYVFWWPRWETAITPDMPSACVDYESIAVGEFLGARGGPFIDLKATSLSHAQSTEPDVVSTNAIALGEDAAKVEEREAHYKDVITVDYKRSAAATGGNEPTGVFQVSLANGQAIAFPTIENGVPVHAALENIRARTRRAKSA